MVDLDFPLELFLENESVSLNRFVVGAAEIFRENCENTVIYNDILKRNYEERFSNFTTGISCRTLKNKLDFNDEIKQYSCKEFEARFQIKKSTVKALIRYLKDCQDSSVCLVPMEKKVHVFLWLLTNNASFKEVGHLFQLQRSSVANLFHELATLLNNNKNNFIMWPSIEEQNLTSIKVNSHYKFPNCVGFIDACSFKIGSKKNEPETILLQAVCDENLMFIDIHIGPVGVTSKSSVFQDSTLSKQLKNYIDFNYHILGNEDYKLGKYLITPFKRKEGLTSEEIQFNEVHLRARSYIERAFELLKSKFVKLCDVHKQGAPVTVLSAACVLHNFILLHEATPVIEQEAMFAEECVHIDRNIIKSASDKQLFLCNYINNVV